MTKTTDQPLQQKLSATWPTRDWRESHVVLAVSGGLDSVAMLQAVLAIKRGCGGRGQVHVAHFNHRRRSEADADQEWVESLCRSLNVAYTVESGDIAALAAIQGDGWEAAARSARYEFLRQTAEKLGARFVAVAHTADDQVETVLQRIVRGTGIAGLRGIPFARPLSPGVALVRPLLNVRRQEVLAYLEAIGQTFRSDASNADLQYTRNRLRHELLPTLRTYYNADVDAALLRMASQACETQELITKLATDLAGMCVDVELLSGVDSNESSVSARVRIDCRALTDQSPLLIREVCKLAWTRANWPLQAMGFEEWRLLADCAVSQTALPPGNLPGNIRVRREANLLILEAAG